MAWLLPWLLQSACTCEAPLRLRIGLIANAGCSLLALAEHQKLFAEQNLQVEIKSFATFYQAQKAWTDDKLDIFCGPLTHLLLLPTATRVILIPDYSNGAHVLIARKDAGTSLNDLKGARIGLSPTSMGEILLTQALAQGELTREDFTVLPEEGEQLSTALQKSEIQLAVTAPPHSLNILKNDQMHVLFRSSSMPGDIIDAVGASAELLQKYPQLVHKMEAVWQEVWLFVEQHPTEALRFLAQNSELPVTTIRQDYKFLSIEEQREYLRPEGRLLPLIHQLQTSLLQTGSLKNKRDPQQFLLFPTER